MTEQATTTAVPLKDQLRFSWTWDAIALNWRISMVDMGDGLLAGYDHLAGYYERRLIEEIERLQKRATKPAHEREAPHCSSCSCGLALEPPGNVLSQIDELLQTMIISAEVFTDADGSVTGYKIKTGALHKIVGLRTHLFFPQNMKEAERLTDGRPSSTKREGQA